VEVAVPPWVEECPCRGQAAPCLQLDLAARCRPAQVARCPLALVAPLLVAVVDSLLAQAAPRPVALLPDLVRSPPNSPSTTTICP
jgi:hypothetical protein